MVLDAQEIVSIEELKHKNKLEFETIRHTNQIEELKLQLEIAKEETK